MSSIIEYAKSELDRIGKDEEGMQAAINQDILQVVDVFANQGHSGFSAGYALNILERLLRFKPLKELTGEDDEWNDVSTDKNGVTTYQNKRCSSVFKRVDRSGKIVSVYDIDGVAVSDDGGITWFTSNRFTKEITFPYFPPTHAEEIYIEYTEDVPVGYTGDNYEIITDKPDRIKALREKNSQTYRD